MLRQTSNLIAASVTVFLGCSLIDGPLEVCTLVGCESGLTVTLETLPPGALRIECEAFSAMSAG